MSDRRTGEVVIYSGTDLAKIAELHQNAERADRLYKQARESGTAKIGPGDEQTPQQAKDAHDAFVAEAAERAEIVKLRAIGRRQWRALLDKHPARTVRRMLDGAESDVTHDDDEGYGVNTASFSEALLTFSEGNGDDLEQTIVSPEFASKDARLKWLDNLSGGDFDRLFLTAYNLNGSLGFDPKEAVYSPTSQILSATPE